MTTAFDLNLLPVARYAGRDYPELLCLHIAEPPRRAARGRSLDRLVLYLAMTGNAPLPPAKQEQVLAELAKLYYRTPGTVTSALRSVAEELNTLLLDRNLRGTSSGRQGLGLLTQLVLREQQLYLAQSGPVHAFLITSGETRHFYDSEMEDRSLGQERIAPLNYAQIALQPNDTLVLAAQPASSWNADSLSGLYGQGPESLRRRLFGLAESDLNAILILAKPGKGKFYLHRSKPALQAGAVDEEAEPLSGEEIDQPAAAQASPQMAVALGVESATKSQSLEPPVAVAAMPDQPVTSNASIPVAPRHTYVGQPAVTQPARPKPSLAPVWKALIAIGAPLLKGLQAASKTLGRLLGRILPGEVFSAIPSSVMAFIAVVVPVVMVTIASLAYFQLGRAAQYDLLLKQARQMAIQAAGQTDLLTQHAGWESTLQVLSQVESYGVTSETKALRAKANSALDELDLIRRVNYQPAIIGGLPASVNVTRMVISENDLYLLDSTTGKVIRVQLTRQGYEIDPAFQCGSGAPGVSLIGPLIDIVSWPASFKPRASLLALDANGNVLYCRPNQPPELSTLPSPPNSAGGKLVAFTLGLGNLYILDPLSNAVWVYWNSDLTEQPTLYFDEEIPFMQDVVDLAVNSDELYMLHVDGHLTLCNYRGLGVAPTRCSNPPYVDFRLGRENTPLVSTDPFTQLLVTDPPDPSVYVLEPKSRAIYHFSLRNLAFQHQFLPQDADIRLTGVSTAFAVNSIKRNLFLAIGNQIYYAVMP